MGGPTRHVEMSRELVQQGWDVTIAASDFHLHRRSYLRRRSAAHRDVVRETIDDAEMAWLWASPYEANDHHRILNWLTFSRELLRLPMDSAPTVVIGSSPHLFAALAAWRVARRHRVPFVLEVRDLWPESLQVAGRRPGPGYAGLWALARFLYRVADRVIVLAEGTGDHLASLGVSRAKIEFIPNGVDVRRYRDAVPPARDSLRLVYAGAHGPANGLDTVLDAAERLRHRSDVRFALVGDGPARSALRAEALERGLGNVEFHDPLPKTEIPRFLAGCDAGLMVLREVPVFSFGVSPNQLFDYWAAGLPVVCNVAGEVAATLERAGGGVQATDATGAGLAEAIELLRLRAPSDRRAMGRQGRDWVIENRDREQLARRLDAMLRDLTAMPAARAQREPAVIELTA